MKYESWLDTSFVFCSDCGRYKDGSYRDPDAYSPTLKKAHKTLWSKKLPNGELFTLEDNYKGWYLHHKSRAGEFFLSSDSVTPTFSRRTAPEVVELISQIPKETIDSFYLYAYTIGGMMIYPCNPIDGKWTINQARGCTPKISDRFDLTMECVRRYYLGEQSPLFVTFKRYDDFFRLFQDFKGYVDFFLLQDIVSHDYKSVVLFSDFLPDFSSRPIPKTVEEYLSYREKAMLFLTKRNIRIAYWIKENIR